MATLGVAVLWPIVAGAPGVVSAQPPQEGPDPDELFGEIREPTSEPCTAMDVLRGRFVCLTAEGAPVEGRREVIGEDFLHHAVIPGLFAASAATVTPTAQGDLLGTSLWGATSLENRFTVNGADVTELMFGGDGLDVPIELVERIDVRSAADVSRRGTTGGLVDVETRRGTDAWTGAVFVRVEPPLLTRRRPPPTVPSFLYLDEEPPWRTQVGAVAGGPILREKLWIFAGVAPDVAARDVTRVARIRTDDDQDGVPDTDADGAPVYLDIERRRVERRARLVPYVARLDVAPAEDHRGDVTAVGGYRSVETLDATAGEVTALLREAETWSTSLSARWRSAFAGDRTVVTARAAWVRQSLFSHGAADGADAAPQRIIFPFFSREELDFESEVVQQACADGAAGDPYPLIDNCPAALRYRTGGIGRIADRVAQRVTASVGGVQHFELAGPHRVRVGWDVERTDLDLDQRYSGGYYFQEGQGEVRYVDIGEGDEDCDGDPCRTIDVFRTRTDTVYHGVYLGDAWSPRDDLHLDAGVRWEGWGIDSGAIAVADQWSPRGGVVWDPTKIGRARIYAFAGRFYLQPALAFNDDALYPTDVVVDDDSGGMPERTVLEGFHYPIDPDLRGHYQDELDLGAEYVIDDQVRVGASYMYRRLGRVIEDAAPDYAITNPGDAEREVGALTLSLASNPENRLVLRAAYTYLRVRGTYEGLFSTYNGQVQPHRLAAFDDVEVFLNSDGPMPIERPHQIWVDAYRRNRLSEDDELIVGARLRWLSGRRFDVLGVHPRTIEAIFLLPRGAGLRADFVHQVDARVAYVRALPADLRLEVFAELFNVFDIQTATFIDQDYTIDPVRPIVGGDFEDLVFLKRVDAGGDETAVPAVRDRNFGRPLAWTGRFRARFGLRLLF